MTSPTSKIHEPKFGFLILCHERKLKALTSTVNSIKACFPGHPHLALVGNDATKEEITQFGQLCEVHKAKETITSLINLGMKKSKIDWNVIVFAGSWLRPGIHRIFNTFAKSEKDILFPVVDRKTNFIEGSMNGIMIHKKTFKEIGDMPTMHKVDEDHNELEWIKTFWALGAIDKGCTFKAIIGTRIC